MSDKKHVLFSQKTEYLIEAGIDEAGRGCLAGPVVAAAVILPKHYKNSLLRDSKQLKKPQRQLLRTQIQQDALSFAIAEASPEEIDQINILQASILAMHRAVAQLEISPQLLLIDGKYFRPCQDIPFECIVKGDNTFLSIAAASILAKTYRDDLMEKYAQQYPWYEWASNAGYPTKKHYTAIQAHGLTPLHRLSFRLH
jgi:ribonuclease HII